MLMSGRTTSRDGELAAISSRRRAPHDTLTGATQRLSHWPHPLTIHPRITAAAAARTSCYGTASIGPHRSCRTILHSPTATQTNNVLSARRRFTHSFLIVFSISNISVDAVVDRHVSSGISGAQRRESEFLRELTSIRDRVLCTAHPPLLTYVCQLFSARVILRHLWSMFVFLSFSVFIFLLR